MSNIQVVERLRAGDEQAFCALIERLQHPLTGYLHRLVGDREVALDLAQETFIQVYRKIGKTTGDLLLDAWIYRIATNYGFHYLKTRRLKQFVGLNVPELFDKSLAIVGPEEQVEIRILVQQALGMLKPIDAVMLQLHFGNGFTYQEISHVLGLSSEAVRKRMARGVEKFRKAYGKVSNSKKDVAGVEI